MSDLVILGTDTAAGKTTFALLWLAAFADRYEYWKPVESGDPDSARVTRLVPSAVVHSAACRFAHPVAPPLAARLENAVVPSAAAIAAARPRPQKPNRQLLIETFGSPFSPLNECQLQLPLIQALEAAPVLIGSSALGAIGRTLQALVSLSTWGIKPRAVVLIGPGEDYALAEIRKHHEVPVFSLRPPHCWDVAGIRQAAREQQTIIEEIRGCLVDVPQPALNVTKVVERDRELIWHPYTSLGEADPPLVCVGAQDEFLFLADGRRLIDGISSWWTILFGHRHPPLLAALQAAAGQLDHVLFAGVTHPWAVELAELLLASAPWQGGRVFFSDNGSTAVEVALKMAYQYWCHLGEPRRTRFIGFAGGYHGDTFGAMAVSRDPVFFGRFEPLLLQADILPLDPPWLDDMLNRHRDEVAAVILEPLVQGAGGMRMHSPEVLRRIVEVTHDHGVLFIADEVMTGGGRTGTLWAHQAAAVAPDLICAGKTLAGGLLPLAATLVAPQVVAAFDTAEKSRTFFHGHSFTAHPLACAVAAACWQLLPAALATQVPRLEAFWKDALDPLRQLRRVKEVRVRGTIAAVELDVGGGYLADVAGPLRRCCLAAGVLLRPLGPVLYAMPPLCTSQESLAQIARAMTRAVADLG